MTTPGPAVVAEVHRRLRAQQGRFVPKPVLPPLDEVVATVLSQHTSDINSGRAFARLKEIFPNWEQVADAPTEDVADAIRSRRHRRPEGPAHQADPGGHRGARGPGQPRPAGRTRGRGRNGLPGIAARGRPEDRGVRARVLPRAGRVPRRYPRAPHRDPAGVDPGEDNRRCGTPAPRADRAGAHPLRPARRAGHSWPDSLPGAAATLRRVRAARPVRLRLRHPAALIAAEADAYCGRYR